LNELVPAKDTNDRRQRQTVVQRLNQQQAFRILVNKPGVVYSDGQFYQPRTRWVIDGGSKPILDFICRAGSLDGVGSEKGELLYDPDRDGWFKRSIFGLVAAVGDDQLGRLGITRDPLIKAMQDFPIWLCDDDSREITDFIGINDTDKKLVFVHAKVGKLGTGGTGFSVTNLQEVGRQALASLAFISQGEPSAIWTPERWNSEVQTTAGKLRGRDRIFRTTAGLTADEINEKLKQACSNPSYDKEVWIVGAKMVRRKALDEGLNAVPLGNRLRQFLMHWDALQTACARASVRLKLFCQ